MKTLVIYDSNFGNTELIAKTIAHTLSTNAHSVEKITDINLEEYDLIIVGSPINGWRPTPKIMNYLKRLAPNSLHGVKAATFDTRVKLFFQGDAAKKIAKDLKNAGAEIITQPKAFYVTGGEGPLFNGEIENAKEWALSIKDLYGQIKRIAHSS